MRVRCPQSKAKSTQVPEAKSELLQHDAIGSEL